MITDNGYPLIADFRLSKVGESIRLATPCH